jgi:D-serine deaminase-like pyridoxal phosphate-dependent protein
MKIPDLPTPSLLVDRDRLTTNIARMHDKAARLGVKLRPHLKTAKSAAVCALATANGRDGITVSTLREAEYFATHGVVDITYAVGIVPSKLAQAAQLMENGVRLKVITDSADVASAICAHGAPFDVLVEIDCGDERAGVQADGAELTAISGAFTPDTKATLSGVLTHAGHSYAVNSNAAIVQIARQERDAVVLAAERLRHLGHTVTTVSAGSTPTALLLDDASGLTELRAGVYMFFDLDQQSRNVCQREDIALSVLASVIGHNRTAKKLLLDSGGLALSKDTGANAFRPDVGYGEVCDASTCVPFPGLYVSSVSQEHGHVVVTSESTFQQLPVGAKVRILPNHACMTAAAYDRYHVLDGTNVVEQWDRTNGW